MLGSTEIWVIAGIIMLLFGAAAIPKLARSIGKAKNEFEKGVKDGQDKVKGGEEDAKDAKAAKAAPDDQKTD